MCDVCHCVCHCVCLLVPLWGLDVVGPGLGTSPKPWMLLCVEGVLNLVLDDFAQMRGHLSCDTFRLVVC